MSHNLCVKYKMAPKRWFISYRMGDNLKVLHTVHCIFDDSNFGPWLQVETFSGVKMSDEARLILVITYAKNQ